MRKRGGQLKIRVSRPLEVPVASRPLILCLQDYNDTLASKMTQPHEVVVPCIAASLMDQQHDLRCIGRSTTGRRGPSLKLKPGRLGPLTAPLEPSASSCLCRATCFCRAISNLFPRKGSQTGEAGHCETHMGSCRA